MISSNQQRCHGTDPTHRKGSGFVEVLEGSPSLKARWGSPVPSGVIEVHRSVALRTGNGQPWARAANLPVVQDVPRFPDISPLYLEWLYYIWLVGQGTWMDYDFPHISHHLGNFTIPSDEVHDQPDIYKAHFLGLPIGYTTKIIRGVGQPTTNQQLVVEPASWSDRTLFDQSLEIRVWLIRGIIPSHGRQVSEFL